MSKSVNSNGKETRLDHLRKLNLPKNKEKFNFNQWENQHREGWNEEDDEFDIYNEEH